MIQRSKYKRYSKIKFSNYLDFPVQRILKFKKSKWVTLKSFFKKKIHSDFKIKKSLAYNYKNKNKDKPFVNNLINFNTGQRLRWVKLFKKYYKVGCNFKNFLQKQFDDSITVNYFKKNQIKKNVMLSFLIKPYFKIDILLWKLKIFPSTSFCLQQIYQGNILVNGKLIEKNIFLKKGDIVMFLDNSLVFKTPYTNLKFLLSFCEIDFYTNTLIILKDWNCFCKYDFFFLLKSTTEFNNFIYYISKK